VTELRSKRKPTATGLFLADLLIAAVLVVGLVAADAPDWAVFGFVSVAWLMLRLDSAAKLRDRRRSQGAA
jgi:hypothetical protein